jgi:hypothetical protein
MLFFAFCLNPLIRTLEQNITGIQIGSQRVKTTVVAFADDVTVFVASPADIPRIQDVLTCYAAASGARVIIEKSKAITFGTWDTSTKIMDIPYHTETTILEFLVTATVRESACKCWSRATTLIRKQAKDAYSRELTLDKRINYIHEYLLEKVWYLTQIYPPPEDSVRQLNTSISWFIRKGQIFRFPMSPYTRRKKREVGT